MEETWKPAINIDCNKQLTDMSDMFLVSDKGSLFSKRFNRKCKFDNNNQRYIRINYKGVFFSLHRIVISTFQPESDTYECVNHKDKNTHNNSIDNLEWCDYKYNNNYLDRNERLSKSLTGLYNTTGGCKIVHQLDKNNNFIKEFPSVREASRQTGINYRSISLAACGKYKTAGGYKWEYA